MDQAWKRASAAKKIAVRAAMAMVLGLMVVATTSLSHAQTPNLGTAASFAVLAGSTVTNTGPSVLIGSLGVSPGSAVTGFPPGIVTLPGTIDIANGPAIQAESDLTTAFNSLAARPPTQNLTGQNLGGLTLTPGVYTFNSSAQLTGNLTLNALGNPNAVFIFNIASTLTTASASSVTVVGGGPGTNVFWVVGSSATLGTTTSFVGDILALQSITLTTGANIACGSALARNGAVTLNTNLVSAGSLAPCTMTLIPVPPTPLPPAVAPIVTAITTGAGAAGAALPPAFLALATVSPSALASTLAQLSGQAATGIPQAGAQAMNSFLSLITNPFGTSPFVGFGGANPGYAAPPLVYKASIYNADATPDPRRWGVWAAGYGGAYNIAGNSSAGISSESGSGGGMIVGVDYRATPYTTVGVAVAVGDVNYGLSGGLGGGSDNTFQTAVYSMTRFNAAYVAGVLAFGWDRASTSRIVTVSGIDTLTADFSAYDFAGRIEGGYRFAVPGIYALPAFGITPYAAFQMQAFVTPSYGETAATGSSAFALAYNAQTTTTYQTELGAWLDEPIALGDFGNLSLWNRVAWVYDNWSDATMTAAFQSLPGSTFTVMGAAPAGNSLLVSPGVGMFFRNGISLAANFTVELGEGWQIYGGTGTLRYTW